MYSKYFKKALDFIVSLIGLILLFPILIIVTLFLIRSSKGKPFFFQIRTGLNGKLFKIIKFKTMTDERGAEGEVLSDLQRLTKIGAFVRKTSLDELPQLINVLIGDMSLIGPRPLLPEYLPLYNEQQIKRHIVKPGITGWAQVNGRNTLSWENKFKYDIFYTKNINFALDIKILFKTVLKVLNKEGINKEGEVTTTPFTGNN